METNCPTIFTIFGATGDLTQRKLLPALYFLESQRELDGQFRILCVARRQVSEEGFRKEAAASVRKYSRIKVNDELLEKFLGRISYAPFHFSKEGDYALLKERLECMAGTHCPSIDRIFYLAIPSELIGTVVQGMEKASLTKQAQGGGYTRVVFEKPFGSDLRSAKRLNRTILSVFDESQIYRIDHYLAKELVQNLLVMRFGNSIFEPLWNKRYIDHIQITVAETIGVENRAHYYDTAGSLRDVVQNHIMQLLCLVAMASPKTLNAEDIRNEKVKILTRIARSKDMLSYSVKGQYASGEIEGKELPAYRQEKDISRSSLTDTYFAMKLFIRNRLWRGVPFYVRTGKRLKDRATEIVLVYKQPESRLFKERGLELESNLLFIRVQPDEGITLQFNAKVPGNKVLIEPVDMDFCHECKFGPNSPESYERLLHDVMHGDQTLFTRWDEVEHSWKIIDRIAKPWKNRQPHLYEAGTWGPKEADELIGQDGRKWINPSKPGYVALLGR
ncbi:TPA: glucose-6-phosphate dehydrogenase [Candidatus Woesearchaeota archaeon]|nr:glucose-6-phosphate dehydrogenase [Candidatus Woesearchaeota archaeon]